jgi:hypothetical protein
MAMRKYQSVEKTQVLSPEEQTKVSENLHKLGKTSARGLTDEERAAFKTALDTQRVI